MKNPVKDVQQALEAAGFTVKVEWGDFDVEDPSVEIVGTPYGVQVSEYMASVGEGVYTVGWWKDEETFCNSPQLKTPSEVVEFIKEKLKNAA